MSNHRIALGIEYDGSRFCGWQMQSHDTRTVQQMIEQAVSKVADEPIQVTCAGRTDTGVHATGQVVHFDTSSERLEKAWVMGGNAHLPDDVCIHWAKSVDESFSARFSAIQRYYRYIILNRQARSAIYSGRVTWMYEKLDAGLMHSAAQVLCGEQDFSAFRSAACQAEHARRCVTSVNVQRVNDFIYVDIRANAFLHHMVRNIVGSLLMVGQGLQAVTWIQQLLNGRDRTQAGPTAAADGLYLVGVEYPPVYDLPASGLIPSYR